MRRLKFSSGLRNFKVLTARMSRLAHFQEPFGIKAVNLRSSKMACRLLGLVLLCAAWFWTVRQVSFTGLQATRARATRKGCACFAVGGIDASQTGHTEDVASKIAEVTRIEASGYNGEDFAELDGVITDCPTWNIAADEHLVYFFNRSRTEMVSSHPPWFIGYLEPSCLWTGALVVCRILFDQSLLAICGFVKIISPLSVIERLCNGRNTKD